eukprot:756746-Hanusia_phi.AAC.3
MGRQRGREHGYGGEAKCWKGKLVCEGWKWLDNEDKAGHECTLRGNGEGRKGKGLLLKGMLVVVVVVVVMMILRRMSGGRCEGIRTTTAAEGVCFDVAITDQAPRP